MGFRKITTGYVEQIFDKDGNLLEQKFIASAWRFKFRIVGTQMDDDTGEPLYWSNEDGWVDKDSATLFDHTDYNLPIGGRAWEVAPQVRCQFCGKDVPENTAHRHGNGWVGDECCWDERLRSSE